MSEHTNPHGIHYVPKTNGVAEEPEAVEGIKRTGVSWWDGLPAPVRLAAYALFVSAGPAGIFSMFPFESKDTHAKDIAKLEAADVKFREELEALKADVRAVPSETVKKLLEETTITRRRRGR